MARLALRLDGSTPHACLLSNGSLTSVVSGAGGGGTWRRGVALTAWSADRVRDAEGSFLYLRDLEGGAPWSAGHQPVRAAADEYEAWWTDGVATIARVDHRIETRLEICVAREDDVEIRRLRLRNRSRRPRRIEVTTAAEIVLNDDAAHAGHPAFSKLFVQTAFDEPTGALLACRRPRSRDEHFPWLASALAGPGRLGHETDRCRFLGRGRSAARPIALEPGSRLSKTVGSVLDPLFAFRRTVRLPPGEDVELRLLLAVARERDLALELVRRYGDAAAVDAAFVAAAGAEREERRRLGVSGRDAVRYQRLAAAVLYGDPSLRSPPRSVPAPAADDAAVLARHGLSLATPFVLCESPAAPADVASAAAYWRARGLEVEVRSRKDLGEGDLPVLRQAARLVVRGRRLPEPARRRAPEAPSRPERAARRAASPRARPSRERLHFDNGYGGFSADGKEYVIRLAPDARGELARPPMPWVNVVANDGFGFLASESGAGSVWARNSRENRITPWSNDPVLDPHEDALYLRDEDDGEAWSPLPGPAPSGAAFEVRHGFGASRWRSESHGLEQEVTLFVPRDDPLRIARLRLTNRGRRRRRLSILSFARLAGGGLPSTRGRLVATAWDRKSETLLARNPLGGDFGDGVVFAAAVLPTRGRLVSFGGDRASFIGRNGSMERPAALSRRRLDGRTGAGLDACAALQASVAIAAGETIEAAFLLGEAIGEGAARALVSRYRKPGAIGAAVEEARAAWSELLSAVHVRTPSAALDLMLNGWLLYQTVSCRLRGRTAFYQSGGAFGFRDQLQDAAALVLSRPERTREQILLHAAHQFVEGDVLHWWHPPADRGTRTRFSDDLLWLPYVTAFYVRTTGDRAILAERAPFVTARPLAPGEDEAYLRAEPSGEAADLYEHCCRALDRSLTRGAHGLPLMGTGDWNDGMNRVGREGRGESVWLGFFLYDLLGDFVPICAERGDEARAARFRSYREALHAALDDAGWDGEWYRRAYDDAGRPLGSRENDECRIDVLAQAWAVISGAAPPERARRAMDAVERELVREDAGLIRLIAPPFDRTAQDPGYIKGYVPGIRENGGQYTHAALWAVRAAAELGNRDRAARWLEMMTPVRHTEDAARTRVYQVEPYVVAADVYAVPPHVGRGGWTWYTGSAAWMYRVAIESVIGLRLEDGKRLRIAPRIPDDWPELRIVWRVPGEETRYEILLRNPDRRAARVRSVEIDGRPGEIDGEAAIVPLSPDGRTHRATITLG